MKTTEGFLVVLKADESLRGLKNTKYKGIDRVPSYCFTNQEPIAEEVEAMDRYILGDLRNELGLIESYDQTLQLLTQFAGSPRQFEIIWCRKVQEGYEGEKQIRSCNRPGKILGFDVALLGGDYWSIVGDFPGGDKIADYITKLNNCGLFDSANDATDFLNKYRLHRLPDFESPFAIVEVALPQFGGPESCG